MLSGKYSEKNPPLAERKFSKSIENGPFWMISAKKPIFPKSRKSLRANV